MVMWRAWQTAEALQRTFEGVLTTFLTAALPDVEDVPVDMQTELIRMTRLSDRELWAIAQSTMLDEH